MALPDLHIFERLVKNKPAKGSNDYPLAIKATDLDENWKRTTLIEGEGNPKPYEVEYTKDGTRIKNLRGLPQGATAKQFDVCENGTPKQYYLLVWDDEPQLA
jgi:hypothetical protein